MVKQRVSYVQLSKIDDPMRRNGALLVGGVRLRGCAATKGFEGTRRLSGCRAVAHVSMIAQPRAGSGRVLSGSFWRP